ncbi:SUMO protein smt3 [Cladophialophora chaetospira]|uniref:SUMO protein smt3 n=1 Tax=Cladophialophora chaetospira TaxID=386627 RepID=A0AA38X672_9EURO|nr:SUMO protein smt3 [Cladophialophora chaetospira]
MDDTPAHPDGEGAQQGDVTSRRISIVVKDGHNEVHFKVKGTTKLAKVMDRFCESQGKNPATVRFGIDGERIRPDQTPDDLDMEDGDIIEMTEEQIGGCEQ